MKREQERLEAEAQAAKEKDRREQVQRESDMLELLEGNADAEQDSVTPSACKTPTSDLMMNVLNRPRQETQQASSPTVKEDITKRPFDLERCANHPLPALRQAYKDIKLVEKVKAQARSELDRIEAEDGNARERHRRRVLGLPWGPKRILASERLHANLAKDDSLQLSSSSGIEQLPVAVEGSLPSFAPVPSTVVPSPSTFAPTPLNIATGAGSTSAIKQTTIKPILAQPAAPTSVPDPIEPAVQRPVTESNNDITPREAIQRLSHGELLKKREELTKRLKEIEAEIRLLDEETERVNAAGRADAFKQVLDQHLHELNTGVRTFSPYFPQYVRPSQLAAGPQAGPLSATASVPAAGSASTTASATAAAQSSLPPLFRSMPTHGHPPIHPNQLPGKTQSQPAARPVSPAVGSVTAKELLAKWDKAPAPLSKSKSIPPKPPTANPLAPARFASQRTPAHMEQHARLSQSLSAARGASPAAGPMVSTPQASTVTQKKDVAPSKRAPIPMKKGSQPPQPPSAIAPTPVRPLGSQQPPSSASSNVHRSLPPNKKAAITEPPRTGAVSPYGHSLADAPETSALLAELESLTSGAGTPVQDTKPSSEGHGGYQFPSSAMYSMHGTGSPSFPGMRQPFSSPYHHPQLGASATQPIPFRPTTSAALIPRASASTQAMDKGKGNAKSPTKVKAPRSTAKLPKELEEKRLANRRNKCPVAVQERADRVGEQRMCIVHRERDPENLKETINILGSTGNVYTVEFGKLPTCTCPDFFKGNHCKHIIFVALKVLRMPQFGDLWYQKAYLESELRQIFASAPPNAFDSVVAPANVQKAFREHVGLEPASTEETNKKTDERDDQGKRKPGEGDECPICADEMAVDGKGVNELVYDLGAGGCGQGESYMSLRAVGAGLPNLTLALPLALHKQCFQMWAAQEVCIRFVQAEGTGLIFYNDDWQKTKGKKATCVYCRHEWAHISSGGSGNGPEFDMADG